MARAQSGDPHHPRAGRESNIRHVAPSPARPRLCASAVIVRAHSGPTANAPLRLDPWIQFFIGHGFAVLDVDYRGSTGYGRAYRNALRSQWGILDVSDCVDAVQAVRQDASIDPNLVFISGASAGGYTALRAATSTTQFRAATIRSAIVDPVAWRTVRAEVPNRITPTFSWVQSTIGRNGRCSAPESLHTVPSSPFMVSTTRSHHLTKSGNLLRRWANRYRSWSTPMRVTD